MNQSQSQKPSYVEKTGRIQAWSQLIKSVTPFIWLIVILIVVIPLIGKGFIANSLPDTTKKLAPQPAAIVTIDKKLPNGNAIDQEIRAALKKSRLVAKELASEELDRWLVELFNRVDNSFLPWYFDYFNQKKMEFRSPFIWLSSAILHWRNANNPFPNQAVAEKLTEDFQREFAKRVLRPRIAQLELERITKNTTERYIDELTNNIYNIQTSYHIPQGQWERYLDDIAVTITDTEGNISNLSMKVLLGGSTYLFAKAMIPATAKIGSKVALSFAGKASAKMAAKTGSAVAASYGLQFLDPIIGIGIIIWDAWDYQHTVEVEKPILRDTIFEYLQQVKASLLEDSILSSIYQIETGILKSL
jgi:hypothetical protein